MEQSVRFAAALFAAITVTGACAAPAQATTEVASVQDSSHVAYRAAGI